MPVRKAVLYVAAVVLLCAVVAWPGRAADFTAMLFLAVSEGAWALADLLADFVAHLLGED